MPEKEINSTKLAKDIGKAIAEELANASRPTSSPKENASSVLIQINKQVQERASRQASYANRIRQEMEKRTNCQMYAIPKIYREYIPKLVVTINGCTISVPCDGRPRLIHNDYVNMIEIRLRKLDEDIDAMGSNRNITEMPRT